MSRCRWVSAAVVAVSMQASGTAWATPRPLPFTYNYETLPEGQAEVEQYVDLTPVKANEVGSGAPVWYAATQFQTELEYGVTDHVELAVYAAFAPTPSTNLYTSPATLTEGTGLKERLRLRIADENVLPVDIALYGELVEYESEFEIEAKIILQKRFGNLRIAANLWAEREFEYASPRQNWIINPTLGATYQVSPVFHLGVDSWMRAEFPQTAPSTRPFNLGPHEYVGPAVLLDFGKIWWSTGIYVRLDELNRTLSPDSPDGADAFGPIWVRSIVGVGF